jgi:multicomponent Na+:H+ antiporter subunit B
MNSIILRTATRGLMPALVLFSIVLLLGGHNSPGGGFVGGLVAASAFALHAVAFGISSARAVLRVDPRALVASGLLVSLTSGLIPLARGQAFMTGTWTELRAPGLGAVAIGTPVVFDLGVYLLVIGVTLMILFPLAEE